MSYVAEPYGQFVDDLLTALTGGATRQRFVFLPEERPFDIKAPGPILPATVRVFGQVDDSFTRFRADLDYVLVNGTEISWLENPDGARAEDAVWPDEGTPFFVNFEYRPPPGVLLPLSDRNPGSVTRLLAESFGREYAVLSRQLEAVYRAGFLETAERRDLDQLVALVGLRRRITSFATGTAVFGRSSPAPADIFIPSGTRLSTSEPPPVVFETTVDHTLRRGELTADVPVISVEAGAGGVVPAGVISVIHRPILGIENVGNPQPTRFSGSDETDEALRSRAQRALEGSGRATTGALMSALTSIPELAEKDIRIAEDHLAHPGVIRLNVVLPGGDEDEETRDQIIALAHDLIEQNRPAGVRVEPNFRFAPPPAGDGVPIAGELRDDLAGEDGPIAITAAAAEDQFLPVRVDVLLVPATLAVDAGVATDLKARARELVEGYFDGLGLGDVVVYNRLVGQLMAIEGLADVDLQLGPESTEEPAGEVAEGEEEGDGTEAVSRRRSVFPASPDVKPILADLHVQVGGQLVVLDVTVNVTLIGAGLVGDLAANRQEARAQLEILLRERITNFGEPEVTPAGLENLIGATEAFEVSDLHYEVNYVEAGVRIRQRDAILPLTGLERIWIGSVKLTEDES